VSAGGDGFLSRWARRKADSRSGVVAVDKPVDEATPDATDATPLPVLPDLVPAPSRVEPVEPVPLPTLEDVARLTHASDYSPYVDRNVDARVRNAAMKKLFSDPHFNVMDGLDTYIDDYGKPDPIPPAMLRLMNQSAALGLFDDEPATPPSMPAETLAVPAAKASPDGAARAAMAESGSAISPDSAAPTRADDDPDLQLQPDDADRRAGTGPGPGG
jgi:hypothetical protein